MIGLDMLEDIYMIPSSSGSQRVGWKPLGYTELPRPEAPIHVGVLSADSPL
jgi:hypothetical protein